MTPSSLFALAAQQVAPIISFLQIFLFYSLSINCSVLEFRQYLAAHKKFAFCNIVNFALKRPLQEACGSFSRLSCPIAFASP